MKKVLPLPILTLLFGVVGFEARKWQIASAFEPDSGLAVPGAPATVVMAVLAIAAVAVAVALAFWAAAGSREKGYLRAFYTGAPWAVVFYAVSGVLLAAAGAMAFGDRQTAGGRWSAALTPLLGVCLIVTGVCVVCIGLLGLRKSEGKGRFFLPLVAPGYCGCVWLVYAYQGHTAKPNVMEYLFLFLGIVGAILASYAYASFSFEKPRPRMALWTSSGAAVLLMVSLADGGRAVLTGGGLKGAVGWGKLAMLGYIVYLFCQMTALLARTAYPAELEDWTPPEEPKDEVETGDETDE